MLECFHVCVQCLAAGSSIMNREVESASMRPLAKTLTRHLDSLRSLLREQCFRNQNKFTDKVTLCMCYCHTSVIRVVQSPNVFKLSIGFVNNQSPSIHRYSGMNVIVEAED